MWKSALSISKVCGKGGKTASSFSHAFHGPAFPRLLRSLPYSGRSFGQSTFPFVFKFNRAGIAQCRVHACLVIPEQPGDGFILSLTDRFKALAVQPFHLQRAEQRLRAGVDAPMSRVLSRSRQILQDD